MRLAGIPAGNVRFIDVAGSSRHDRDPAASTIVNQMGIRRTFRADRVEQHVLHDMLCEIARIGFPASECTGAPLAAAPATGGDGELRGLHGASQAGAPPLKEPFTAALIALRLYPLLWPEHDISLGAKARKLRALLLQRLVESQPADGGGWPFFDPIDGTLLAGDHTGPTHLIAPDADTTAVCWSALLLASKVTTSQCRRAFDLVSQSLERDGDVYFDSSGRTDAIALCNMMFFVLLYCEKFAAEHGELLSVASGLVSGMKRARELVLHLLTLDDRRVGHWLRYYLTEDSSPRVRLAGFVAPMALRWPTSEFVRPLRAALETLCAHSTLAPDPHSSLDRCLTALVGFDGERESLQTAALTELPVFRPETLFSTATQSYRFESALFPAACFVAATCIPPARFAGADAYAYVPLITPPAVRLRSTSMPLLVRGEIAWWLNRSSTLRTALACDGPEHFQRLVAIAQDPEDLRTCAVLASLNHASHVTRLRRHISQSLSARLDGHGRIDALSLADALRAILETGVPANLCARLRDVRDLLVYCLGLPPRKLEAHWTSGSCWTLRASVARTLQLWPGSSFLAPLRDALHSALERGDPDGDDSVTSAHLMAERAVTKLTCGHDLGRERAMLEARVASVNLESLRAVITDVDRHGVEALPTLLAVAALHSADSGRRLCDPRPHLIGESELNTAKHQSHLNYSAFERLMGASASAQELSS